MDYDQYAPTYSWARWAVPWVLAPLARVAAALPSGSTVLEAGLRPEGRVVIVTDSKYYLALHYAIVPGR